jgi:hypothetical protein
MRMWYIPEKAKMARMYSGRGRDLSGEHMIR